MAFRTSNPILNPQSLRNASAITSSDVMTINGTVNKTMISIGIALATGWWSWQDPVMFKFYWAFIIAGFVMALIISFKPSLAPVLAPVYAAVEGAALGSLSLLFNMRYPGIVGQAVGLTFATLFSLLFLYKSGSIRVSDRFRRGVMSATFGICIFYLVTMILSLFHVNTSAFFMGGSLLAIGLSLLVVGIAAANLVLDFDMVEQAAAQRSPKYMEWYCAFGLLVTLVWLYVEMLRLLSNFRSRE